MQLFPIQHRMLKDNTYLLFISLLLLSVSIFTGKAPNTQKLTQSYSKKIQKYIHKSEMDFAAAVANDSIIKHLTHNENTNTSTKNLPLNEQFIFVYKNVGGFTQLTYWNTQTVLPDVGIALGNNDGTFKKLINGYYFIQKKSKDNYIILSLTPIKWEFNIASNYLENNFTIAPNIGKDFEINFNKNDAAVVNRKGIYLFTIKNTNTGKESNSLFTIWLRILSIIPLLLFVHFKAVNFYQRKGLTFSVIFLSVSLLSLRIFTYVFFNILQLRKFELFDPSIYGSNIILQSLGDLLINALLFLWLISFIKNHISNLKINKEYSQLQKWALLVSSAFVILLVTYTGTEIIRSMVADSQISFDVLNFFTLSIYSVIGFVVLCCLAIGYYYFCRTVFFILQKVFPQFVLPFFLLIATGGLFLLSFKIGNITQGFELYALVWLLLLLFLIKNELSGFFSGSIIISRMVFWLFFFSASISTIIISENSRKELRNRQHYAELIAMKTNPINNVLLNTALTDFKPNLLSEKFYLFRNEQTALQLKDSLIKNNFISFTDRYDTKVLVYDSAENPLYNADPISFNSITGIVTSQAKPTAVSGLLYYYSAYDEINYISKIVVRNYDNALLGYVFVVINPQIMGRQNLSPELFNSNGNNSIENSNEYAFAVYEKGKLISSHNDYAFSSRYQERYFAGREFLLNNKNKYSELWYNAGSEKYVVVVKENRLVIELITLFSYLFCAFLILSAVSWLIALLVKSQLRIAVLKQKIELSIKQQVHGTIIFFSIFSFLIIGVATILFFINRYERNNTETLSRTIKNIEEELTASIPATNLSPLAFSQNLIEGIGPTENIVNTLAKTHGLDINLYSISGDLQSSSIPLPYTKGIISKKMNPAAYYHLNNGKEIQYFQKEQIGKLDFISGYIPVTDSAGKDVAYLNIPYFISQSKIKEEISNFLITIINLNAFIFLIAGIVALIITNRITNSFSFISEKMKKINLGTTNEIMVWKRNDEIGALVKEYNKMLLKLEASAAALAKSERESAWQEMAKQVAHEIKNPLTPMKLSMQFLQKAIESGAPNIKELGARVSATLVEQIDHLSQIAGEFSRFATIEKVTPELFNLNESLLSVKQLYEADFKNTFTWNLLQQDVLLYADKTHVNRILTNLILNGIQAVEEGTTPNIIVEQTLLEKTVQIKIADNGTGIDEQIQSRIFMPNFTTKSSGTGLGLAMCKRMAEQAGGDLRYETSPTGTSFFITLPIADL